MLPLLPLLFMIVFSFSQVMSRISVCSPTASRTTTTSTRYTTSYLRLTTFHAILNLKFFTHSFHYVAPNSTPDSTHTHTHPSPLSPSLSPCWAAAHWPVPPSKPAAGRGKIRCYSCGHLEVLVVMYVSVCVRRLYVCVYLCPVFVCVCRGCH